MLKSSVNAQAEEVNVTAADAPLVGGPVNLTRHHTRRLRETYRSAGWPVQDILEIELLATGLLARIPHPSGHETLRVTNAGIACLAQTAAHNRQALSAHDTLVQRIAQTLLRDGRIVWTNLSVRARLPDLPDLPDLPTPPPAGKSANPTSSPSATPRLPATWSPLSTRSRSAGPICSATSNARKNATATSVLVASAGTS